MDTKPLENQPEDFSFKWFAQHAFHRATNVHLVELSDIRPGQKIVELACGTGAATRIILEKLSGARNSLVIGIDISASALREAMDHVASFKDVAIQLIQSRAEQFSQVIQERVDGILLCNAIHYISDKDALIEQVSQRLQRGGVFAFNTAFFQGSNPPETEQFYRRWMYKAIRLLKTHYGTVPTSVRVEARRPLSPEEYGKLLGQHGLAIIRQDISPVLITLQGWVDISRYEDFIRGALPGVPLQQASEALQEGVRQALQELGLETVPRNWLSVVAARA